MKRILSLVLSLALLLGSIPMVISAAAPTDFQTNFAINYQDDQWTNAGGQACDTVQVDYQLQGTGLSGTQGAWIAVDLTKLTWVHNTKNGETIFDKLTLERGADSVQLSNQNFYTLKKTVTDEDSGEDVDAWTPTLKLICAVALSADGKTLYIGTYPMQVYNVTYNDLTTVMSFRFAVLPGAQLETDSIRYINEVERAALNQSYIFAMNDGRKGYYYRSTTEPDTLSAIPFTGNAGITGLPTVHAATPVITQAPAGADYYLDAVAAPLSVVATVSDGGTLSYAWYKNATNSNVGGELVSTAATCPITTTAISDAYYYVVVTNTNNLVNGNKTASVTSAPVRVTVSKDPDITALENAKAILDAAAAISVNQKDYATQDAVRNYIHTELSKLVSGVVLTVNDVAYTASIPGTSANPTGTAGSYTYTVTITKNGKSMTTVQRTSPVAAVWYDGVTDEQAAQIGKDKLIAATWNSLLQKNAETKADAIAALTQQATAIVGNAAATVTVSVADSGFLPAVAGSAATSHAGTPGSVTFDVTVTVGAHSHTVSGKSVVIAATPYEGQLNSEALTVATNALNAIEWANIAQTVANTEADVTALIETLAKAAIAEANANFTDLVPVDVTVNVSEFVAAQAGSAATTHIGTNGSVKFTITASVAGQTVTSEEDTFAITATEYKGQLNSEALTVATNALNAIEWANIAQTVANTEADVTALIETLAKAAIAEANANFTDPVPVTVGVTVTEFNPAVAGSASVGHNGTAGIVKFTVTATVAGTPYTTAEKTFNITATEYKGQLNSEALTVATNALNAIEWADIAQITANTEADVTALIEALAKAAIAEANANFTDPVPVTVGVTVTEFNPAVAGSASVGHNGTAGIVKFTVTATVAGTPYTTAEKTFNITATEYEGQLNSEALTVATNALNAIEWADIAQTTANTEADVTALIETLAKAAIAEANANFTDPVPVDVTVTIAENGFTAAQAGSASVGHNGVAGSVKFTVTATVAGTPYTTAEKTFNITATEYKGQLNSEALTVATNALNAIEWADIAQTTANTEATVIAKITAIANAAIAEANKDTVTPVPVTVTVTVAENGFTAAVAGSSSTKREGDNGSVKFTVTATVAGTPYTTAEKTFDIIATYYNGVMDEDAVDAGQEALENLTETTVTVKIGATAAEILEYVKAHLQSFMKGDATGVTVSVTAGADGQYTATLTKGTESAQITLTLTVEEEDPIKLEAPENLYFSEGVASWSAVDHAVSYTVNLYLVSGSNLEIVQTENITSTRISFFDIMEEGLSYVYDVTVHGDGIYYVDSDVSVHSGVYTKNTALTPEQAMLILMMLKSTRADITATAGEGGSISEDGVKTVRRGTNVTYRITADEGYVIDTVIVDGQAIGAVSEYTFQNVQKDHTIVAVFKAAKWQNPFTDVNELNSYYDAVRFVYELGLFEGVSKTEFAPTVSMTRAMFVTVLWRLEGQPVVNYAMQFSDVEENTWYTEAIRWAAAEGIVEGYGDGIYGTNDSVTVEQAAVIMARYAQYAGKYTPGYADLNAFADQADVADWAAEAMQWSVSNGIYLGEAGYLQPKAEAPRSLAAEWMYEYTVRFGK